MNLPDPSTLSFPMKLMQMLENELLSDIIAWHPNGEGFIVKDKERLESKVLPLYFKVAKFTSFNRRLKRWDFSIQRRGHKQSSYFHPLLYRNDYERANGMYPLPQKAYHLKKTNKHTKEKKAIENPSKNFKNNRIAATSTSTINARMAGRTNTGRSTPVASSTHGMLYNGSHNPQGHRRHAMMSLKNNAATASPQQHLGDEKNMSHVGITMHSSNQARYSMPTHPSDLATASYYPAVRANNSYERAIPAPSVQIIMPIGPQANYFGSCQESVVCRQQPHSTTTPHNSYVSPGMFGGQGGMMAANPYNYLAPYSSFGGQSAMMAAYPCNNLAHY